MFESKPTLRILYCSVTFVLATVASQVNAQACLYRGESQDTRVVNRSGEIITPFPNAASAVDCRRLRVATGSVMVYTIARDRQAMTPHHVAAGSALLGRSDRVEGGEPPGLMQQIMVVLEGAQRLKTGSSRSAGADYVRSALPTGLLARPDRDMVIALGAEADALVSRFELTVDGRTVLRTTGPSSELRLPASKLSSGSLARWKLSYAGEETQGEFRLVTAQELSRIVESLDHGSQAEDPKLRQL